MSGEIQKRPDNAPARRPANWTELAATATANPLKLLPTELRPAVARLWMCYAHLLPSALPLCATIRVDLDSTPLDAADLEKIVGRLLQPEKRANHRFASDLLTDLSALVADTIRTKRARAETEARRTTGEVAGVKLADLFSKPPE
jgi:hypothetical protein